MNLNNDELDRICKDMKIMYNQGYNQGYNKGVTVGYDQGYKDCLEKHDILSGKEADDFLKKMEDK